MNEPAFQDPNGGIYQDLIIIIYYTKKTLANMAIMTKSYIIKIDCYDVHNTEHFVLQVG